MPRWLSVLLLPRIEEKHEEKAGIYRKQGLRPEKNLPEIKLIFALAAAYLLATKKVNASVLQQTKKKRLFQNFSLFPGQ
jgi:hypothetical protein